MSIVSRQMGIYSILNTKTRRLYIGFSTNIPVRLDSHLKRLRAGRHDNHWLQAEWTAFGEHTYQCDVLEETKDIEQLPILEREWIQRFGARAYNVQQNTSRHEPAPIVRGVRQRYTISDKQRLELNPYRAAVMEMLDQGHNATAIVKALRINAQVGFAFVREVQIEHTPVDPKIAKMEPVPQG